MLAWLPSRGSEGYWPFIIANLLSLIVIGAPVSALFTRLQDSPEVSLHLNDDSLQNYLMVPELCHMPTRPVHELDLARQAQAGHEMPHVWHMVACPQSHPGRHGLRKRTRKALESRDIETNYMARGATRTGKVEAIEEEQASKGSH